MQPRQISTSAYVAMLGGPPSSFTDLSLDSGYIASVGLLAGNTNLHRGIQYVAIVGGPPPSFTHLKLDSGHKALVGLLAAKANLHRHICCRCGEPTIFLHRLEFRVWSHSIGGAACSQDKSPQRHTVCRHCGGPTSILHRLESGHIALVGLLAAKTNLHKRICRHVGGPTMSGHYNRSLGFFGG